MFFFLSFYIDDWFTNDKIGKIVAVGLVFNFTGAMKFAADFGFLVTHFRPEV